VLIRQQWSDRRELPCHPQARTWLPNVVVVTLISSITAAMKRAGNCGAVQAGGDPSRTTSTNIPFTDFRNFRAGPVDPSPGDPVWAEPPPHDDPGAQGHEERSVTLHKAGVLQVLVPDVVKVPSPKLRSGRRPGRNEARSGQPGGLAYDIMILLVGTGSLSSLAPNLTQLTTVIRRPWMCAGEAPPAPLLCPHRRFSAPRGQPTCTPHG